MGAGLEAGSPAEAQVPARDGIWPRGGQCHWLVPDQGEQRGPRLQKMQRERSPEGVWVEGGAFLNKRGIKAAVSKC